MAGRTALRVVTRMTDDQLDKLAERVEYIVGQIGVMWTDVRVQIADLRTEMVDRDANLLKSLLGFFVAQTAALGALMALFR